MRGGGESQKRKIWRYVLTNNFSVPNFQIRSNLLFPIEQDEENSIIDTQKMRAFVARRRWKVRYFYCTAFSFHLKWRLVNVSFKNLFGMF